MYVRMLVHLSFISPVTRQLTYCCIFLPPTAKGLPSPCGWMEMRRLLDLDGEDGWDG